MINNGYYNILLLSRKNFVCEKIIYFINISQSLTSELFALLFLLGIGAF